MSVQNEWQNSTLMPHERGVRARHIFHAEPPNTIIHANPFFTVSLRIYTLTIELLTRIN